MRTITESFKDGVKVLRLFGRFDFQARKDFQTAIEQAEQGGARHLILNLQGISFLDSAALGILTIMHRNLIEKHIRSSLANPRDAVKQILELAKMDQFFSIHATEEQAMSSMAK